MTSTRFFAVVSTFDDCTLRLLHKVRWSHFSALFLLLLISMLSIPNKAFCSCVYSSGIFRVLFRCLCPNTLKSSPAPRAPASPFFLYGTSGPDSLQLVFSHCDGFFLISAELFFRLAFVAYVKRRTVSCSAVL